MFPKRTLLAAAFAIALAMAPASAALGGSSDVAKRVEGLLTAHCLRCHGGDGSAEGGINYILDVAKLIERGKVKPGNADASPLFRRVAQGEMPADADPLPAEQVELLQQWIASGAPPFVQPAAPRGFVSDADVLHFLVEDLGGHASRDRPFLRYFTLTHLYNAGAKPEVLTSHHDALAKLVNSLSWGRRIVRPQAIDPAGAILRIDLRDYGWTKSTWERIVASYTYRIDHQSLEARMIRAATNEALPFLRADWFVARASVPPLYHEILGLPQTEKELLQLLQIDLAKNLERGRAARAGFNGSGVSQNNRLIERHESPHGAYWRSYDFKGNNGDKNLFAHPVGLTGKHDFAHDGGEIIFNLPNGLQGYMLVDAQGNRIDQGPVEVVSDPKRPDQKVTNGLSCMSCHAQGIIPKEDQVRQSVLNNPGAYSNELNAILALYPPKEKMASLMKEDADRFVRALQKTGVAADKNEPVATLARRFEESVDVALAAAEAGLPKERFLVKLEDSPNLSRTLAPLRAPGGVVQREVFEKNFVEVRGAFLLGREELGNTIGMRLRLIPAGDYLRGSLPSEDDSQDDERPRLNVTISQPFYLGMHEVTVGQFRRFVTETNRQMEPGFGFNPLTRSFVFGGSRNWENPGFAQTDDHPVVNVSWNDAAAFCEWLSNKEGVVYRLPTEAEWEYACRAGAKTRFAHGDLPQGLERVANIADAAINDLLGVNHGAAWNDNVPFTARVGSFLPNAFGLFDMHGNVWEWCADRYAADAYATGALTDPQGPPTGSFQVARGGSWFSQPAHARSADRTAYERTDRNLMVGFRVVREAK